MSARGDWIQTFTGRRFFPCAPEPDDISVVDIAHALSNLCRFAGHCVRFYSVAEHSVLVSRHVSKAHRLTALLHDAAEAYLCDIPRPLKPALSGYKALEQRIDECVAQRFKLPWPWPPEIKEIDNRIIMDEQAQLMVRSPAFWSHEEKARWGVGDERLGIVIEGWPPPKARGEFLSAFTDAYLERT